MRPLAAVLGGAVRFLSSLRLAFVLLLLLGLLTWLGTLEQVSSGLFEVQKKYFESFFLVHRVGSVPIPLPGANLVLSLLGLNLVVGGIVRMRKGVATAGVLVAHVGILVLLASAFVKHRFSEEGHVTLFEGQSSSTFQSYFLWELAVLEDLGDGRAVEHRIPHERLGEGRFAPSGVPFEIEVLRLLKNCEPMPAASDPDAVDGFVLEELAPDAQAETNIAGAAIEIHEPRSGMRRKALLWGAEAKPFVATVAGKPWAITLRRETYPMPFTVALEKFTKEDHPRMDLPRSFSSDVKVTEHGTTRPVRISMNEPLRSQGLVLYQASWGPSGARPGARLFSTLAVVRNPADRLPLIGCIVITLGLVAHFSRKLLRFVRVEGKAAALLALPMLGPQSLGHWTPKTVDLAGSLAVQDGGRVKPLSTFAQFTLLRLSGKKSLDRPAAAWLLDVLFFPEEAAREKLFLVQDSDAVRAIGIEAGDHKKRDRWSYEELQPGLPKLFELAHEYDAIPEKERGSVQHQVVLLAGNVMTFLRLARELDAEPTERGLLAIVPPEAGAEAWRTVGESAQDPKIAEPVRALLAARERPMEFEQALASLAGEVGARAQARGEGGKIALERFYYGSHAIGWSLAAFLAAFVIAAALWLRPSTAWLRHALSATVAVGVAILVAAIAMRCVIRGRPPVSTLYETVLFVTAVGGALSLVLESIYRNRVAVSAAAVLGCIGLFVANGYETLDKQDTMPSLVAVLDTNFWLATHVTAITIGYSAGLLAALLASVYLLAKILRFRRGDPAFGRTLARMVYGVVCFAVIFSTVGTILGGIWANESWGRFWGWDPKENGALLIVISQLAILHGRLSGVLREHGQCMAAAFGGTVIAFSWWGVNLLGVGLHSYGFTSGVHTALWTYYGVQWGVVLLGGIAALRERAGEPAVPQGAASSMPNRAKHGRAA